MCFVHEIMTMLMHKKISTVRIIGHHQTNRHHALLIALSVHIVRRSSQATNRLWICILPDFFTLESVSTKNKSIANNENGKPSSLHLPGAMCMCDRLFHQ